MKNILITGSTGFLGTNLISCLNKKDEYNIMCINSKSSIETLYDYAIDADFVFNFAGIHRPVNNDEFEKVNAILFEQLIKILEKNKNNCPVLYSSSIQAIDNSPYGLSKIHGENILKEHVYKYKSRGIIYRLTNMFGPFGRPNGHSVVATFCYNINHDIPIIVNNPKHIMHFYYVKDVVKDFLIRLNETNIDGCNYYKLNDNLMYDISLQELADKLYNYRDCLQNKGEYLPKDDFDMKLFNTYISYK